MFEGITAEQVKAMREKTGKGFMECLRELKDKAALERIDLIRQTGESAIADVLEYLMSR